MVKVSRGECFKNKVGKQGRKTLKNSKISMVSHFCFKKFIHVNLEKSSVKVTKYNEPPSD